eukprot:1766486-Rhodomonas_salina.1
MWCMRTVPDTSLVCGRGTDLVYGIRASGGRDEGEDRYWRLSNMEPETLDWKPAGKASEDHIQETESCGEGWG